MHKWKTLERLYPGPHTLSSEKAPALISGYGQFIGHWLIEPMPTDPSQEGHTDIPLWRCIKIKAEQEQGLVHW